MTAQYIINEIAGNIGKLENEWHFTNSTGWNQVLHKGETQNRYYGQYEALVILYEELTCTTWITKPQTYKLHS